MPRQSLCFKCPKSLSGPSVLVIYAPGLPNVAGTGTQSSRAQHVCGTRHGQRGVIRILDKPSGMEPKAFPSACQGHLPICHHSSCVAAHFVASTGSPLNPPLRCEDPSTKAQLLSCWTKIDAVEPASRMLMRWLWSLVHACPWAGASAA